MARAPGHIGALTALTRAGIPIDCIAGTSAGALVGSLFCAGVGLDQIRESALRLGWWDLARPVWPRRGFLSFARLERWLRTWLGDLEFAALPVPFAAIATDLERGAPVVLRQGPLAPAVRASCSAPGVVVPAELNGRLLGDGGVVDNLPVAAARTLGADFVIAVDLFHSSFRPRWGPLGLGFAAVETLVRRAGGGLEAADCLISPDLAGFSYFRMARQAELMARVEQAVEEQLPRLRAALDAPPAAQAAPAAVDSGR